MIEHSRQEPCVAQPSGEPSSFDFDREVRLGLVLYGGVSLAVYMCGVAEELHRAVRGRGVYGLVKALIRSARRERNRNPTTNLPGSRAIDWTTYE